MKPKVNSNMQKFNNLEISSLAFVEVCYMVAKQFKPSATIPEVEGLAFRVLVNALDTYQKHEQLSKSSQTKGAKGTANRPSEIPTPGFTGGKSTSPEGIQPTLKRSSPSDNRKKRRSKKA